VKSTIIEHVKTRSQDKWHWHNRLSNPVIKDDLTIWLIYVEKNCLV